MDAAVFFEMFYVTVIAPAVCTGIFLNLVAVFTAPAKTTKEA